MTIASCILVPAMFFVMWIYGFRHKTILPHKVGGILLFALLVIGFSLTPRLYGEGCPSGFGSVAKSHIAMGKWFLGGMALMTLGGLTLSSLPMKLVRTVHGVMGLLVMLLGPTVAWAGWQRWARYTTPALTSSPALWYLPVVVFALIIGYLRIFYAKAKSITSEMSETNLKARVELGDLLLVVNGLVIDFAKFDHPGGKGALMNHLGLDASEAFANNSAHSQAAKDLVNRLAIAKFTGMAGTQQGSSTASLVEVHAENPTVKKLTFRVKGVKKPGQRLYIHHMNVARPYTAISVDGDLVQFAIRIVPQGKVSSYLDTLKAGVDLPVHVGSYVDQIPPNLENVLLIAGGTGITPIIAMLKGKPAVCQAEILWWIKNPKDLFLIDEMIQLAKVTQGVTFCFNEKAGDVEEGALRAKLKDCDVLIPCSPSAEVLTPRLKGKDAVIVRGPSGFCQFLQDVCVKQCGFPLKNVNILD
jgi:NAD(P)H-flavin reductase